jgi:hypothetical protein
MDGHRRHRSWVNLKLFLKQRLPVCCKISEHKNIHTVSYAGPDITKNSTANLDIALTV